MSHSPRGAPRRHRSAGSAALPAPRLRLLLPILLGLPVLLPVPLPTPLGAQEAEASELLCPAPAARAFDFWIGEWDVLNRTLPDGATEFEPTGRATNRVYPVVGGCGIVEHWRGEVFHGFLPGFSLRVWDPAAEEWRLALLWPGSGQPAFGELRGAFRHGRGEFFSSRPTQDGGTLLTRYTFSDITSSSFRWDRGVSTDGGRSWLTNWIMEFTRRERVADAGLWNGVAGAARLCADPEHRRFDDVLGEWTGHWTPEGGEARPVRVHMVPLLEGCAHMERVVDARGRDVSFRIRAYEPGPGRWVTYELDGERGELVRRHAAPTELVFQEVAPEGAPVTRRRWVEDGDGPRWIVEEAPDPAGPWRPVGALVLVRSVGVPPGGP